MARVVPTEIKMELSAAAFDEFERKLLDAGYDLHFFYGPAGSPIWLNNVALTLIRGASEQTGTAAPQSTASTSAAGANG